MPRRWLDGFWVLPMLFVFAFLAAYLIITKLPASAFGSEWQTIASDFWPLFPWLLAFFIGLAVLRYLIGRRR
jgi:hypothetical protein